jgi:hypothetical protein
MADFILLKNVNLKNVNINIQKKENINDEIS